MKKMMIVVLMLLASNKVFSQNIGMVTSTGPVLTYPNQALILSSWTDFLNQDLGIQETLTSISIVVNDGHYFLVVKGSEYKSSTLLQYNQTTGVLSLFPTSGIKTTCTTKACANTSGCEVKFMGGCTECPNGDCLKSTSNAFLNNLPNY